MNRRRFLSGLSATCALTLTGCISDDAAGPGPGDGDGTADPASTETESPKSPTDPTGEPTEITESGGPTEDTQSGGGDDPDETGSGDSASQTPGEATIEDESFSVTDSGCGQQTDDASVSFDDSAGTVSVTGTIWASDLTYTAVLDSATVTHGELSLTVTAERTSETAIGGQCLADIDYEASVTIDGDLPSSVSVLHRRGDETTRVTTADR